MVLNEISRIAREQTSAFEIVAFLVVGALVLYTLAFALYFLLVAARRRMALGGLSREHWVSRYLERLVGVATVILIGWTLQAKHSVLERVQAAPCVSGDEGIVAAQLSCCPSPLDGDLCASALALSAARVSDILAADGSTDASQRVLGSAVSEQVRGIALSPSLLVVTAALLLLVSIGVIAWTRELTHPSVEPAERRRVLFHVLCLTLLLSNVPALASEALTETAAEMPVRPAIGSEQLEALTKIHISLREQRVTCTAGKDGRDGEQGQMGPRGADGLQGPQGIPGPPGSSVSQDEIRKIVRAEIAAASGPRIPASALQGLLRDPGFTRSVAAELRRFPPAGAGTPPGSVPPR